MRLKDTYTLETLSRFGLLIIGNPRQEYTLQEVLNHDGI